MWNAASAIIRVRNVGEARAGLYGVVIPPTAEPGHHQPRRDAAVNDAHRILPGCQHPVHGGPVPGQHLGGAFPVGAGVVLHVGDPRLIRRRVLQLLIAFHLGRLTR